MAFKVFTTDGFSSISMSRVYRGCMKWKCQNMGGINILYKLFSVDGQYGIGIDLSRILF